MHDLLRLLDLPGREADPPASPVVVTDSRPMVSHNPTALAVDAWGLRRGADLVGESDRLQKTGIDVNAAADFFCAAFDPDPQLLDGCIDHRRHQFLSQLLEAPDYRSLHAATQLNDVAASIAAVHFAEQFHTLKQEDAKPAGDEMGHDLAVLRAVGKAVSAAEKEVGDLNDAALALGMGEGAPGSNDPKAIAALFRRVRKDPSLQRICELAGRFRRVAQSRQRRKTTHGLDDIVGIEPGGDVGRLLPMELAKLMLPELELDTLRRIAERQALCREYHAVEPVGKGPIIVAVDESASMQGDKAHTAKAFALALAWIARRQRRWCGLIAYSGDSGERLLSLPPGKWDEKKLMDWLSAFIGAGSTIDVPVREMPRMYAELRSPPGITDIIFVTDAECSLPIEVRSTFLKWRAVTQARLISIIIDNPPGDLAAISDEVHTVQSLTPEADAVGRVLSL